MTDDGPLTAALGRDDAAWAREHLERDVVAWLRPSRRTAASSRR